MLQSADCSTDYKLNPYIAVSHTNRRPIKNMIGVVVSRLVVREPNPEFLKESILPYTVSPLDFLDFFHLSVS